MPRGVSRQSAAASASGSLGCEICDWPCYNQQCSACGLPLCHQCISRPHQCASRAMAPRHDHQLSQSGRGAGDKGVHRRPLDSSDFMHVESEISSRRYPAEAREISSSSINSETDARGISSSSINTTESVASSPPWHKNDTSDVLFSQYFQMKRQQQDDTCVTQ